MIKFSGNNPYVIKEEQVFDYFKNKASADEFAKAYAYMNCIVLKDYSNCGEFANDMSPTYVVLDSSNDEISRGETIQWNIIESYIDDILTSGVKDDIECLYYHLTDKY